MEILRTEKEFLQVVKNLTYKDIKKGSVKITVYTTPKNNSVKYDVDANFTLKSEDSKAEYDEKDYIYLYIEGAKVGGYGYDRWSTALSNGLNIFKQFYKIKTTLKYKKNDYGYKEFYTQKGERVYGLSLDKYISYGIGESSVLYAVKKGFSNVKLTNFYNGKFESQYTFEIIGR